MYSGTWVYNEYNNNSCAIENTESNDNRLWFGNADGDIYDTHHSSEIVHCWNTLSIPSGSGYGGIIFRASSASSSFYILVGITSYLWWCLFMEIIFIYT